MIWTRTHTAVTSVAACAVVVAGAAVLMLAPTRERVARTGGPAVNIAVVDPREPVVTPGGVMEVGDLADGYEHRPVTQPVSHDPAPYEDDWNEPLPMPEPRRWTSQPSVEPQRDEPVVTVRADGRPLSFGFDEPLPDFDAQRRERRARMDRTAEAQTQTRTPGVQPTDDSVFY